MTFFRLRRLTYGAALMAAALVACNAQAAPLLIYDNDWDVSDGGYVAQDSLAILLADRDIKVIGLTAVSGDFWRDEGVVSLLRFLELIDVDDIPVMNGAVFPLSNSLAAHRAWEAAYGPLAWSGAWNTRKIQPDAHPDDPYAITPPKEGPPRLKPNDGGAVQFLVRQVRAHPHQITIYAEGPLTNIALALKADPQFVRLVKRIVVQGSSARSDSDDGSQPLDFNCAFDPEAAQIVLSAPWSDLVLIGDVSNHTVMTAALRDRIARIDTPAARYAASNAAIGTPLWAQLGAAVITDPAIITTSARAFIDVDITHGRLYGRTRTQPGTRARAKALGRRPATLVTAIDRARFIDDYVAALTSEPPDRRRR